MSKERVSTNTIVALTFSILIAFLIGIGYLGLKRMDQINANLDNVLGRQWTTLHLSRRALAYSSRNSRITMEIFLLSDRSEIDPLLKSRAENTQRITEIVTQIESQCDTQEDKQLLAAVKDARAVYVASYQRALHLLIDEHKREVATTIMLRETTPALFKYHSAWEDFAKLQMDQMDRAAKDTNARYYAARALLRALIVGAIFIAMSVAVFATRTLARDKRRRVLAEREVRELNAMLERKVEQRTLELAKSNQKLASEVAERKSAQNQLRLQATALEAAANSIVITDVAGKILWVNSAFTGLTSYSAEEAGGQTPRILKSGKQGPSFYANLWRTITSGNVWHGEITNRRKDGILYEEEMTITPVRSASGEITHFVAVKQDITKRKAFEKALSDAEEKYRSIFQNAGIGIFQTAVDGRIISANPALARIHGYDSPEHLMEEVSNACQLFVKPNQLRELSQVLEENNGVNDVEIEAYCKDGSKKWLLANVLAVRDVDGKTVRYEGTVRDITQRKAAEEQVQFLAFHDALTGLPNRSLLCDRLAKALASASRCKEKVALLFLDLDHFKNVNDSLGHSVGDLLLKEIAKCLKKCTREEDTVARLGGDEFVVVLTGVKEIADAAVAADRIMKAISTVAAHALNTTCSLGISVFPDDGTDGEVLIKNADAAMYSAKEYGRNNFQFFTQDMNVRAVERLTLENGLRLALEKRELFVEYQPQVDLATGMIVGAEALLRWRNRELGLVPPNTFIPIAENSGMIIPIGEWVLRTACNQARQWQDDGLAPFPVAVNVSAIQFRQKRFVQVIKNVLNETRLAPQCLELELTEGVLLSTADGTLSVLKELKDMGLKLSIDDFGTGYSSLVYLKDFPVNKLKIDRRFVKGLTVDKDDAAITITIIKIAKTFNLNVIAEGVETEQQLLFLRTHNCDQVQGYYFSKPLPAGDFGEILNRDRRDTSRVESLGKLQTHLIQC